MARVKRGVTSHAKHKKVLKASQRSMGQKKKHYSELLSKLWKKQCNMLIEIVELRKENLNRYGFKE